ncbi:TonB-dependent receptor domain-containing protein [Horticoccus sp. 23ND18S-11]|uniref:TonB-dependent receptor domain-containing protein n=1 Tax=Horticoccus sp. 23ND18S-11 TaxID=3391832 RepID=UPI0039C92769
MNLHRLLRSCPAPAFFRLAALLTLGFLSSAVSRAQGAGTGTVSGRILNQGTGEYLRNAVVAVVGSTVTANAEDGGNYTLNGVPAGAQRVRFTYAGLDAKEETINVTAGQVLKLDVSLSSAAYDKNIVQLGQFVVASEREGNAKAIMEQKQSIEAKRVLATDTFGSISEGNVGEFLKYLPGVLIDYVEADARSVSLGGLDPKYTSVTLDGSPIASSGLAAAGGTGANRAFEFEQMSINGIETVELSRTPQPENPGSALAGVVNLRSKGAFDRAGRLIGLRAGFAFNSMSGQPWKKQPGWDDEDHYRIQPNWGIDYSDVFLNKRLGVRAGYNYSFTFAEQKAEVANYAFDTNLTNNDSEIPRVTSFSFRDSPKPTIRYNGNIRVDFKVSDAFWVSARAEYNRYHAKFFSRDLNFNFTTTANSPDPDGAGTAVAGPVVPGAEYSLSSQTATVGTVQVNQGGGATNKYGSTANFGLAAYYKKGAFRADFGASLSRSMTWYKDQQFGFFWSIEPNALGGLGLRFNRDGPADPALYITQTSGPDYRNLANHPVGFAARQNDRQGEDQRYQLKADFQYTVTAPIAMLLKSGVHVSEWVNNADRPVNNYASAFRGRDGVAASADESLAQFAEARYRMNFDLGGNVDGMANVDRWAAYKIYQTNPGAWTAPTDAQIVGFKLQNARDAQEQIDALYLQPVLKFGRRFTLAPGVRFEHTRGRAAGPSDLGQRETDRRIFGTTNPAAIVPPIVIDRNSAAYLTTRYGGDRRFARQDYNTWLRYLHSTYRFSENLVLKGSWNQAISRPDMNRLIGGLVVTNDDPANPLPNRANAGNADLVPELSNTSNLTLEYYTRGIGQFSVSAFRRDFKNLIRSRTFLVPAGGSWNGELLPSTVSPEDWEINTVDNVGKAHMASLEFSFMRELSFLPGPLSRIRVNANYTRMRYDAFENYYRPRNVANLSWYIPYRDFRLQWNTNWRPGYRTEVETASNGWANHVRESLTHTLDFTWNFRRNMDFFVNARNVFNQDGGTYRGRSDLRTRWVETGAIWATGVRATF